MMPVENREIAIWVFIMLGGWLLFSVVSGLLLGVYMAINVAEFAAEVAQSAGIEPGIEPSAAQIEALTNAALERMREVDWWLWWPLLNSVAWLATAMFLGFMKVVKFNEGLVAAVYLQSLLSVPAEWEPPDSFVVEGLTIVLALAIVHFVSRWVCAMRASPLP